MRIITLVEDNIINPDFGSEHGVSIYIETENHRILFDLGQTDLFIKNAQKLNINLAAVDTLVISHGHYDHGGGLKHFLKINDQARIYIHKCSFNEYYSMRKENEYTYIGLDKDLDQTRFVMVEKDLDIDNELSIFNQIDTSLFYPLANQSLFKKTGKTYLPDDFRHEQNLLITCKGLSVLFAGCAHRGIVNIINQAQAIKTQKIDYVFGGFHLQSRYDKYQETEACIKEIAYTLKNKQVKKYYTGHCTGIFAYNIMKQILHNKIGLFYPGLVVDL